VPPEVRLAEPGDPADVAAIAGLRHAWTSEQAGEDVEDDSYEERFAAWFERERHQRRTWLGLVDGGPVAMLNLLVFTRMPKPGRRESRWGYLANFYVLPAHRDSGLGTCLLAACTAWSDARDLVRIVLSPSERSVPAYLRAGFAPATSLLVRPGPR
jgi:GNAT superfamily N-acetyltransferase